MVEYLRSVIEIPDLSNTKYRYIEKIGSGGMGSVYLVKDIILNRNIALKVLNIPDSDGELSERMMQEARIIAALEHPGIVPIHDVGTLSDDRVFYTMKYIKGSRLDHYVKKTTSLSETLRIFQKVCETVAFAHSYDVIHRDLKPDNIMVGDFGEVLVMDWGLAKEMFYNKKRVAEEKQIASISFTQHNIDNIFHHKTKNDIVLGTPAYMAPEQARGEIEKLDRRADIYALGAILYFILTGSHPTEMSPTEKANAEHTLQSSLIPPRKKNPKIPKQIEAICLKSVSIKKEHRYSNAMDLSTDIDNFLSGQSVKAYRESIFEIIWRWINNNKFVVSLIFTYVIIRFIIYFLARS